MDREELLRSARNLYENPGTNEALKVVLEETYPELKESEDERIRKNILALVKKHAVNHERCQMEDYLEKQKEHKLIELPKSEDYGIDGLYLAIDILQKTLGEVDGYQTDDGILEHKCAISAVKELYEQQKPTNSEKPKEWSEGDEWKRNELLKYLKEKGDYRSTWYSWLESLPERFNLPPKQEWSEDFEENIRNLLHDKLTGHSEDGSMSWTTLIDDKTLKDIVNGIWFYVGKEALKYPNKELSQPEWSEEDEKYLNIAINIVSSDLGKDSPIVSLLKSLRPRTHWRPSDAQMDALRKATYKMGNSCFGKSAANDENLHSLYIALEKLL